VQLPSGTQIDYVIDGKNRRVGKKINNSLMRDLFTVNGGSKM